MGKFALIDDGVLQVNRMFDRSVVITIFQSGNNVVLDLIPSESASIADDTDYDFWHAALDHPFKASMNCVGYWRIFSYAVIHCGLSFYNS
jgi:hypothetical protein